MSLEFKTERTSKRMSVRFVGRSRLAEMCMKRCGRDVIVVKIQLVMVTKFLGTDSVKPDFVSFGGVSV